MPLIHRLWWKLVPGTTIRVKWYPTEGQEIVDPQTFYAMKANCAIYYKPELIVKVGRQGIHWDWCITEQDIAEEKLSIKFFLKKKSWASYFALKWP